MTNIKKQNLTLAQYVQRRNGVPLGHNKSLINMLSRSFGASSFAKFWQYWNPIWGYGLGKYIHAPLQRFLPPALALILTFTISGAIHDLATMVVRGSVAFLFTPWFFLSSIGVVLSRKVKMNISNLPWWGRALINLTYLVICLIGALAIKNIVKIV